MCQNYVGYYRVSTEKQGRSGLGLDAQQTAVEAFIASRGADAKLVASYVEVESGKRSDNRPELTKAMEHARLTGATLLIAKLDRLSRDAHFLLGLQKAGVRFVAADMPEANELVVGIMAVIAQAERKMISTRTKAALAGVKEAGRRDRAADAPGDHNAMAGALNSRGYATPRGDRWTARSVLNVTARLA
jgi:DNA invertase Pin-like site-specific DNA recombinase